MTTNNKDIWVFAQLTDNKLHESVKGLIKKAAELKNNTGGAVVAVVAGYNINDAVKAAAETAADRVIAIDEPALEQYKPRTYCKVLVSAAKKYTPEIFVFPATPVGRELAPRIMAALRTGLTADAIDLGFDEDGDFVQTTPGFGGEVLAHICIPEARPQMVTVRPGIFTDENEGYSAAEIIYEDISAEDDTAYEIVELSPEAPSGNGLKTANIVVAAGRGIKKKEDIELIKQLADVLGAEYACSRPLADSGWMEQARQLGQSGISVKPDCVISVGISGASQFAAGISGAKLKIAVNKDVTAPIFKFSQYGAVADYQRLIPALISAAGK